MFLKTPPYGHFWTEYKYNKTKLIQINIKHDCILPHFIQFSKQMLLIITVDDDIQKQLYADVLQNTCS